MYKVIRNIAITITVFIICLHQGCQCPRKYAVIISSNNVTMDDVAYHSVWWYDVIHQYRMLLNQGFTEERIFVLYGNGTDFNTTHNDYNATSLFGHSITDMAANRSNVFNVFIDSLRPRVDGDDFLHVWWMGHGTGHGPGQCSLSMELTHTGEHVSDTELKAHIDTVQSYNKRFVSVMTCHAGGMIDNMDVAGDNSTTFTSSTCIENSFEGPTCNGRNAADYNYWLANSFEQAEPCGDTCISDTDGNGFVSLEESFQYIQATVTTSTPQLADPDALAPNTYIAQNDP